jgi:hypothetical protein
LFAMAGIYLQGNARIALVEFIGELLDQRL